MSAHTAGQRAAIMADLAVASLPKSFITSDMIELGPTDGMPVIGNYSLAMLVAPDAQAPVKAAATDSRRTRASSALRQCVSAKRTYDASRLCAATSRSATTAGQTERTPTVGSGCWVLR